MALPLCQRNSDKASMESSTSLSSSRSLLKPETTTNEGNTVWNTLSPFQEPRAQQQSKHQAKKLKDGVHRRCSSSSITEQSSYAGSSIPAFVYIPRAFSLTYSSNDEASSSEEEPDMIKLSHEFHQLHTFPNLSDVKHNAAWGITLATVNDVIADEKIQIVRPKMDFWPSTEGSPLRQPKPPLSQIVPCQLLLSSLYSSS